MKPAVLYVCLAGLATGTGLAQAATVGFQTVDIPRTDGAAIKAAFWYPSDSPETLMHLLLSDQEVALDGLVLGRKLSLVAISPGTLGDRQEHADTAVALAKAGFVVVSATPDEFGPDGRLKVADRVSQLDDVIDFALHRWRSPALEPSSAVGVFGFSLGGFATLVIAGGKPDTGLVQGHCRQVPSEWSCVREARHQLGLGGSEARRLVWQHDARVGAIVVVAPALGYVFGRAGLSAIKVPVQLWQAGEDNVLAEPWNAQSVKHDLPINPEFHLVPEAAHADFAAPCATDDKFALSKLCVGKAGFSRAEFHANFNRQIVRFFQQWLVKR